MPVNRRLAATAITMLLAVSGCAPAPSESPAASGDGPEQASITVGVLPIVDVAPIYLAIDRGLFAGEGLDVSIELVQGGAAAIPALVSGDLDFSYGNWVSFLLANQRGIELRAVAAGVSATPGFTEFLALPTSGLEGKPVNMAGATVALNTLNNIGELALRSLLEANGLGVDDVQLLEVAFPDMGATLERGDVDVIWASEPVPTIVKGDLDAVVVADSFSGDMAGFPVAGYQATAKFVADNPRTVAAFRRGLAAAIDLADSDPGALLAVIPGYTNLPADVAGRLALPRYESAITADTLERVLERLRRFEMIEEGLDVDGLVAPASEPA